MDSNTVYFGGIAAAVGAYGYGVYRLPKLEGYFKHEGLYVAGAFIGGVLATLSSIQIGDSAVYINPAIPVVGISLMTGSIGYVAARNFGAGTKKALIIGGISALVGLLVLDKSLFQPSNLPVTSSAPVINKPIVSTVLPTR